MGLGFVRLDRVEVEVVGLGSVGLDRVEVVGLGSVGLDLVIVRDPLGINYTNPNIGAAFIVVVTLNIADGRPSKDPND